jgi:tetratricopeptide (TPR) repeat protein
VGEATVDLDRLEVQWRRLKRAIDADAPGLILLRARALLANDPTFPAWWWLGSALTDLARYEEAEAALTRAIETSTPEILRISLGSMGDLWNKAGDNDRAETWYRRAIEADPDHATGYIYLGAFLARRGRLEEAEEVHRAATKCTKGCLDEAFLYLGLVLRAQERFEEAAECFREAIHRDPDYRLAKRALRDVLACIRESRRARARGPGRNGGPHDGLTTEN